MAQTLQSLKDTQHRALLFQAQARAVRRQQHGLQDPMQRLQNQLKRLQDMQRWGSAPSESSDILCREPPMLCLLPSYFQKSELLAVRAIGVGRFITLGLMVSPGYLELWVDN